jgi:gliding motility-associated-like protein
MKTILPLLVICVMATHGMYAQQANIWYFGDRAGLNFNTSPPSALLNSQMFTHEGCATISDSIGNLLFYTDGRHVWNRDHQVMPNGDGLMGHESSTHSAIVIPKPGSNTMFYLFTADADENAGAGGYNYSEVDMTLNGGRGDVTANKNIYLYGPSTEKLTAASHANGIDIWVITKDKANHVYRSYLVTCNGVSNTPVLSTVAAISGNTLGYKTGCIKVSPDGTKIASARNLEGRWDLLKFDNSTGVISDRIMIMQSNQIGIYGVEFSPNSQLVYLNGTSTYQYKVDVHDSATIFNSRYQVDSVIIVHDALQLGPDGKIYSNTYPNSSVINSPNVYGVGCNYVTQAISLGGRAGHAGYPTFFNRLVTNYNVDFAFNFLPDCKTVNFFGNTNVPGSLIWTWDFGDGNTGTGQNVMHAFPSTPNQFLVTLTITNPNVCGGTFIRSRTIVFNRVTPTADFSFETNCNSLQVDFQDLSTIGAGAQIISRAWDFGDGNTSSLQNPSHVYAAYGTYHVRLVVESNDQCSSKDTMIKTINVAAKPAAAFSVTNGCYDRPFQFNDLSTIEAGSIDQWYWDFGDGNLSTVQNPVHGYAVAASYIVKLVVSSEFNCQSDTVSAVVVAGAKPNADFILPVICLLDATANFINTTAITDTSTINYLWNFDDPNATPGNPNTSTLAHPTHIYSAAAEYNVKLIAATYLGCIDSIVIPFTVNGAVPRANFIVRSADSLCSNMDVVIRDSSYVDFGNVTKLEISWGDGNTTIDLNPGQIPNGHLYSHRYANFGMPSTRSFTIRMKVYSGTLCMDSCSKVITVNASPAILFEPPPQICNETSPVNLTATEIWGLTGTGSFSGPGITNTSVGTFDPSLLQPGSYQVTFSFITNFGCRADSTRQISIDPTPMASFSFDHGCLPNAAIQFNSSSSVPGGNTNALAHVWNFGDPLAGPGNPDTSTLIDPVHIYRSLQIFDVILQVTSTKGCLHDTLIKLQPGIHIFPQPKAQFRIDSLRTICAGSPVYFINQSSGAGQPVTSYNWSFGDGTFSTAIDPAHTYSNYGTYPVSLWIRNEKGCMSDTVLFNANIHSIPKADFSFDSTCVGKPVQFRDQSTNSMGLVNTWAWDLGNGNAATTPHPVATYATYDQFTVSLRVATSNGCASALRRKSFQVQRVHVMAGRDTAVAKGQPLQLLATGAAGYTWNPATGLNSSTVNDPVAILYGDQTYYLKGITKEGCAGFDTLKINVFNSADIYLPNAFTPNGDGLNDQLQPVYIGIKQLNYFRIFDRWGNIVFSTGNQAGNWNARNSGIVAPAGNYVWVAQAVTFDGDVIDRKGSVLLIR